ncbi:class I SAM-dependent methyltransferase [Psychrobacter aestuarii]|uniref:Class I SAM-dependent methyltransferase n=1 Tax=Psychrobacter aestuarii TaxID=556327 RepID=A0ABP3FHM2_9GAMM|nr:class I SAM-dependent methyltransferase [Psychrobacter aestuarii]
MSTSLTALGCQLLYTDSVALEDIAAIERLVADAAIPLTLQAAPLTGKLNTRYKRQLSEESASPVLILEGSYELSWLSGELLVTPAWHKLQRRVVRAGRKYELLLQAAKINEHSRVVDGTAGFGHDSLILASTGAKVCMLEAAPIMALLLLAEQQRMRGQPNWQKLMARLQIRYGSMQQYADALARTADVDMVYLDPMFPEGSYQDRKNGKGAKVGKEMQALHRLALPPTIEEEKTLLAAATRLCQTDTRGGRVIVKRPSDAPVLADASPDEQWHNDALRFDGYFV